MNDAIEVYYPGADHAIDNALKRYSMAKTIVPGHGKRGDLALLEHTKSLCLKKQQHQSKLY